MQDIGEVTRRLWLLCATLRDEGISYQSYLTELSQLLFLKLASDRVWQDRPNLSTYWERLRTTETPSLLSEYTALLDELAASSDAAISELFGESRTEITSGASLSRLIDGIEAVNWGDLDPTALGNVYEGLIEKGAQESRYGAGQYFTPRAVVEGMVRVLQPGAGERVYDPAAGTAGFLVSAGLFSREAGTKQSELAGVELVGSVQRLALMNCLMHNLEANVRHADALDSAGGGGGWDVCITNPPFGIRGRLSKEQAELLPFPTNNRQLAFVQHVASAIKQGGRAAVVVPDNVLFESGTASAVRKRLLDTTAVHTILHLPPGIFYATGIKTSVLFFTSGQKTDRTWFYNLRSSNGTFGKRRVLTSEDFEDFISSYGPLPDGRSTRAETDVFWSKSYNDIQENEYRLIFDSIDATESQESAEVEELLTRLNDSLSVAQAAMLTIGDILRPYQSSQSQDD